MFDRIDIPFAPVAKPGDLFEDPQLNAGGRMLDIDFPNGVRAKLPRLPIEIGSHDFALRRQAPGLGEHTAEILAEARPCAGRDRGVDEARHRHRQG